MEKKLPSIFSLLFILLSSYAQAQTTTLRGYIFDENTGESLIGASILVKGTNDGTVTDFDGSFEFNTSARPPFTLVISYVGYTSKEEQITELGQRLRFTLSNDAVLIETVEVKGQRISEKQKTAPLTIESLDLLAIKETPSDNFYDGLGSLKGVDLTSASIGFKIINTRGFNSTSPVRSLQIIDGVDNQAPGLNFSLGNFLGSPELDVLRVDLIQGASSSFYGPGAFNGVISMETKNPFFHKGLSAMVKRSERNLLETALRWADSFKNDEGDEWMAYKFNFSYFQANDWEAENYGPVDGTLAQEGNAGGWDAVNTYGDEYFVSNDFSAESFLSQNAAGLGLFHRSGYREIDLVDYNTQNIKANTAFHLRLNPSQGFESPELILASNFGTGTTVYQGDNRFSLRGILFFQNRIELRKKDKYFFRMYATHEDAGRSYDPYFTALRLQEAAKPNTVWAQNYFNHWILNNTVGKMREAGYPSPSVNNMGQLVFDNDAALLWLDQNPDLLAQWHQEARNVADAASILDNTTSDFFEPGTDRFQTLFDSIVRTKNTEGGTLFFDKSALYHAHGEYTFTPTWTDRIVVGANGRVYRPYSEGTLFKDTAGIRITNMEVGAYVGLEKKIGREWIFNATLRVDKNQNFPVLPTPAASIVWSPDENNFLRLSFSSAIRNPTLTDQYLNLNVGRALLVGNLEGYDSLITVESLTDYLSSNFDRNQLQYFDVAPVVPERVRTVEVGYRTTLFEKLYIDMNYYYSFYNDFIGFNIGVQSNFNDLGFPTDVQAFRIAANSINDVTTQGFAIGGNYYFGRYYAFNGNYSWNKLNVLFPDDPIIPAFNTPEHKFNVGVSGRGLPIKLNFLGINTGGFNVNYKWVDSFEFEGSPQFTGNIPSYALLDAQFNVIASKINTTIKIGASNILNNQIFQTYGGPLIGRLAYISLTYNWNKK